METLKIEARRCCFRFVHAAIILSAQVHRGVRKVTDTYYETVDQLEKMGVDRDYIIGWMGGFLGNPAREEQRITEAYNAGYEDGQNRHTNSAANFTH